MSATPSNGKQAGLSNKQDIVELARKILLQVHQGPGEFSSAWPNVTMQQLRVMMILYTEGPTRVSVLAKRLSVSTPTVTGILDRLVRQGLTYRSDDPRDRRVVLNALTDDGRSAIEQLQPLNVDRLNEAIDRLNDRQQQELKDALGTLAEVFNRVR